MVHLLNVIRLIFNHLTLQRCTLMCGCLAAGPPGMVMHVVWERFSANPKLAERRDVPLRALKGILCCSARQNRLAERANVP